MNKEVNNERKAEKKERSQGTGEQDPGGSGFRSGDRARYR
jgi:hypothetical protein